jgi:chromosomal replication initiator protein
VNAQEVWNIAFSQLELQLDRASFDTWLRGAAFIDREGDVFVIGVRNSYARDMLQHRLYRNVRRVVSDVCGAPVELRFEVHNHQTAQHNEPDEMPLFRMLAQQQTIDDEPVELPLHERVSRPQRPALPESELNPRFTFERFVVNGSNRITYEAARAVAEHPARAYNPLLVHGGVGLGKTHLLQAIAHVCQSRGQRVIYVPSEAFTNDMVDAIRHKTTAMFREKYRSADVLLVDDIQFIAGKDSTQEEFFHTFNSLYTFNKQIVLASDRHPAELKTLEARLRSRFEGGLVSDVGPLEYESRLALLEMWSHERRVVLPRVVLQVIAERAHSNVRELEGVFNQFVAKAQLSRGGLTPQNAETLLERFNRPRQHFDRLTTDQVIMAVALHFGFSPRDLTGKRRTGRINQARQIAMYLTRELTDASLPQIGEAFGGRSHTTVLHGCNKIAEEAEFDTSLVNCLSQIRTSLHGTGSAH